MLLVQCGLVVVLFQPILPRPRGSPDPSPWDWQNTNHPEMLTPEKSVTSRTRSPEFFTSVTNVTAGTGDTVELPCTVSHLGKFYMVSWIRGRDTTVLSVGHLAFSSDNRFSVLQVPEPDTAVSEWTLRISNVSQHDQGAYECQINTEPKVNKKVYLRVQGSGPGYRGLGQQDFESSEAAAKTFSTGPALAISGSRIQYASEGGEVELECILRTPDNTIPTYLHWERGGALLSAKLRAGLSLDTEKLAGESRSLLYLESVQGSDSGEYSCTSDLADTQTVHLVVGKGAFDKTSTLLSGTNAIRNEAYVSIAVLLLLSFGIVF